MLRGENLDLDKYRLEVEQRIGEELQVTEERLRREIEEKIRSEQQNSS